MNTKNKYERFYRLLNSIISKRNEEIKKYEPVMEMLEKLGALSIASAFTGDELVNEEDYERIKLELTKLNIEIEQDNLLEIMSWINSRNETWLQRLNKMINIQKANDISSLEEFSYYIGGTEYKLYRVSDKAPLKLTDTDLQLLEEQKPEAIRLWIEYCSNNNLPMYQLSYNSEYEKQNELFSALLESQYNWQEVSSDYINLLKGFYKWAFLFENSIDGHYNLVMGNDNEIYDPDCSALILTPSKYEV